MGHPVEEAADQAVQPFVGHEKGVVAPLGLDLAETHVAAVLFERAHDLPRLVGGVEPVRGERDHQERDLGQGFVDEQAAVAALQVEVIRRLGDVKQRVGVEPVHELAALVVQVALHLEVAGEVEGERAAVQAAAELLAHGLVGQVGDMTDHARHRQAVGRAGGAVVVAALPGRVGHDRLPGHLVEGDGLGRVAGGGGQGDGGDEHLRVIDTPAQHLHAAHRAADDRQQPGDAQVVDEFLLGADHVADGHHREAEAVGAAGGRVDRRRAGAAGAAAEDVRADDEVAVGVDGPARPDHVVPPAGAGVPVGVDTGHVGVAGEGVEHEDGVAAVGVEGAERLVGQGDRPEPGAGVERHAVG